MKIDLEKFKQQRLKRAERDREMVDKIYGQPPLRITDFESFKKGVSKAANGCWIWTGTLSNQGYGVAKYNGHQWRAHRLAYKLAVGEITGNLYVLHKCDNKRCVNPDHLFLGTHADNMEDCTSKGRNKNKAQRISRKSKAIINDFNKYMADLVNRFDISREAALRILFKNAAPNRPQEKTSH